MLDRKTAVHALTTEFVSLISIVAVAALLQRVTHHLFNGTN